MLRRKTPIIPLVLTLTSILAVAISSAAQAGNTGADALATLIKGNERFVAGKLRPKDYLSERPSLTQGQHPYAIVLACADSRVPPELVFDESLGRIFVVRTAGEVVDPVCLGSIEYAVEHLHVGLLMVLGHESCGAVTATIKGGDASPNIKALMDSIKPAVDKVRARGTAEKDMLSESVKENVRYQMQRSLFESKVINESVHEKHLIVVGGVYSLHSGRVEIVSADLAVERSGSKSGDSMHGDKETASGRRPEKKH